MSEEPHVDEIITKLIKLIEYIYIYIYISILELRSRIDGVGTKLQFLIERLNKSVLESRIVNVNNNFDSYEIKVDKLVRRLDLLENNLNQYFRNR